MREFSRMKQGALAGFLRIQHNPDMAPSLLKKLAIRVDSVDG
jgi:hypothetical protein